jgi:hypothetical protein
MAHSKIWVRFQLLLHVLTIVNNFTGRQSNRLISLTHCKSGTNIATSPEEAMELSKAMNNILAPLIQTPLGAIVIAIAVAIVIFIATYIATTETTRGTEGQTSNEESTQSHHSESVETFTSPIPQENAAAASPKAKADHISDKVPKLTRSDSGAKSKQTDDEDKQGCKMKDHKTETSTSGVNVKKLFSLSLSLKQNKLE